LRPVLSQAFFCFAGEVPLRLFGVLR